MPSKHIIKTCQTHEFLLEALNHVCSTRREKARVTWVWSLSCKLILRAERSFQLWKLQPPDGNLERCKDPIIGKTTQPSQVYNSQPVWTFLEVHSRIGTNIPRKGIRGKDDERTWNKEKILPNNSSSKSKCWFCLLYLELLSCASFCSKLQAL